MEEDMRNRRKIPAHDDTTPRYSAADVTACACEMVYSPRCKCPRTPRQAVAVEALRFMMTVMLEEGQHLRERAEGCETTDKPVPKYQGFFKDRLAR